MCRNRDLEPKINSGTRGGNGTNPYGHRNYNEFVQKVFPNEKPKENLPFPKRKNSNRSSDRLT